MLVIQAPYSPSLHFTHLQSQRLSAQKSSLPTPPLLGHFQRAAITLLDAYLFGLFGAVVRFACILCIYMLAVTALLHKYYLPNPPLARISLKTKRRLRCVLFLHRGELLSRQAQCQSCSVLNERVWVIHIVDDDEI